MQVEDVCVGLPLEEIVMVSLLTPMGDPNDKNCVWGAPVVLWGGAGIGKSSRIVAAAESTGLHLETLFPTGHHPEDFSGIPVQVEASRLKRLCALDEVNRLIEAGRGFLFLDEISGAMPAVQAALLKVVLNRYVGDVRLPGGVRIIAAANPPSEAACGWEFEPPLANRFVHVRVPVPSSKEWNDWILSGSGESLPDRRDGEQLVQKEWKTWWPKTRALFGQLILNSAAPLYALPAESDPSRGTAWPSPRTWEYAARLTTTCSILGMGLESQAVLVEASVGNGAGFQWLQWMRGMDIPNPETVLRDGWAPNPKRLDIANAVYAATTAYVLSHAQPDRERLSVRLWDIFLAGCGAGLPDVVAYFAKLVIRQGLGLSSRNHVVVKAAAPVLDRLERVADKV